jgi:nitrite reductase (NADH) small subunit
MAGFVKVAKTDEIVPGQGKMIEVGGKKIALFNVEGSLHAIDDTCTHRGGPLSEGSLEGNQVTCPLHGARRCDDWRGLRTPGSPRSCPLQCPSRG